MQFLLLRQRRLQRLYHEIMLYNQKESRSALELRIMDKYLGPTVLERLLLRRLRLNPLQRFRRLH